MDVIRFVFGESYEGRSLRMEVHIVYLLSIFLAFPRFISLHIHPLPFGHSHCYGVILLALVPLSVFPSDWFLYIAAFVH